MKSSTVIIFNPTARGDKARQLKGLLEDLAREAELRPTRCAGDASVLAAEAVAAGFSTIVAAGGDGTVNEVLNGLAGAQAGLNRARLAVLPLGTVNVFAKELGIPEDPRIAWSHIRTGKERLLDLPEASFTAESRTIRRHFIQLAGAGLDSRAISLMRWEEKKRFGRIAYGLAGLRALRGRLPRVEVELGDGRRDSGELVLLGNGRLYGGRWPMFPRADMTDGQVDILVVPRVNLLRVLGIVWSLQMGRFAEYGSVRHYQASRFTLRSDLPCEFELEGDNVGFVPVSVAVRPQVLRVVVP